MKSVLHRAASLVALCAMLAADPALANFLISPQGATTLFAVDSGNATATGTGGCASVECAANVPIDKSGAPFGVTGNPFVVSPSGGSFAVTGTFWQATQPVSGTVTANQGGSNWTQNITQFGGSAVATGTGASGLGIPRVTVSNDSTIGQAGTWTVQPGNTPNSTPWLFSISQGGTTALVKAANLVGTTDNALVVAVANTLQPGAAVPGSSSPVVANTFSHAVTTSGLANSLVVKASAGNLANFNCSGIAGAVAGYCIVYNATAAPGAGALTASQVLDFCYFDNTAKGCSLSRTPNSIAYSTGITILVSSAASPYTYTTGTLTAAIAADFF